METVKREVEEKEEEDVKMEEVEREMEEEEEQEDVKIRGGRSGSELGDGSRRGEGEGMEVEGVDDVKGRVEGGEGVEMEIEEEERA